MPIVYRTIFFKNIFLLLLFLCFYLKPFAQDNYAIKIAAHRIHYSQEFISDAHSPLSAADTNLLRFFEANKKYCVQAKFVKSKNANVFDMQTHSGVVKKYQSYGKAYFILDGKKYCLRLYQGIDLMKKAGLTDYLFLPFYDASNNRSTYGGGRYLDFKISDIKNNTLEIDFNKCYNPYCAYKGGYACPLPPNENKLKIAIEAGEKLYAGEIKE
jgi:uncharacterized protein (DUF1684 family)